MFLRAAILIVLAATCPATPAQDLSSRITYTAKARPLQEVLDAISKTSKVHLECSVEMDNEPLILQLNNVTLQETMDKLAGVFGGDWKKTDKGYLLTYGKAAEARHQAAIDNLKRAFQESIDEGLDSAKNQAPLDTRSAAQLVKDLVEGKRDSVLEWRNTAGRVILQVLKKIDVSTLIYDGSLDHIVFSNHPNAYQRELPQCDDVLAPFIEQENLLASALPAPKDDSQRRSYQWLAPHIGPYQTVMLRVDAYRGGVSGADLDFYDADGKQLGEFYAKVGKQVYDFKTHRQAEQKVRNKIEQGFTLGPIAEEIVPHILAPGNKTLRRISDAARQFLISPETNDPLSNGTWDVATGLAGDRNIVYLPTEYGESWAYISSRGGKITYDLFQSVLDRAHETEVTMDEDWLIGQPADPLDAQQTRIPRKALAEFVESLNQTGTAGIDAVSNLALSCNPDVNVINASYADEALNSEEGRVWFAPSFWAANAFYATLSSSEKQTAAGGGLRLTQGDLSKDQMELILRVVLSAGFLQPVTMPPPDESNSIVLDQQPTIAAAAGLGADGYISIKDVSTPVYHVPMTNDPSGGTADTTLEILANEVACSKHPKEYPDSAALDFNAITQSITRTVQITVVMGNGFSAPAQLEEDRPIVGAPMTLDQLLKSLPADALLKYHDALAKAEAHFVSGGQPGSSGGVPPR